MQELNLLKIELARLENELDDVVTEAESLKISTNGSFGKFGSPYSILYSPELLIQTTITGQLAILMLIERLTKMGLTVISANTDGVVTLVRNLRQQLFQDIIEQWQTDTGFPLEETEYQSLHSRDVNNYVAIKTDGKVKTKGAYGPCGRGLPGAAGMKKNPDCEIVSIALVEYLMRGVPLERTIHNCTDIRKFVSVRRVNGGAEKDGEYVGKAIRVYWAIGEDGALNYKTNGNTVPKTEGAKPCMELPEHFPLDVDYAWYIRQAYAALSDVGMPSADPDHIGRTGQTFGRLGDQKTFHIVGFPSGHARCGRKPASIRVPWLESKTVPEGFKVCGKCLINQLENYDAT